MLRAFSGLMLILGAVGATGCSSATFDITQDVPASMIMGDPTSSMMALAGSGTPQPLPIDINAATNMRHTGPATSARLKQLTFTITQPAGGTFYFVNYVAIALVPQSPTSTLPSQIIAVLKPVPAANTIALDPVPGIDMLPYTNEGADIKAEATGFLPPEDTTYVGRVVIEVHF